MSLSAGQIEVTLIGPGYGGSVVIHIGGGKWLIVDSCVDEHGECLPLKYLDSLGVDVESSVKLVAISHWHDDHIRGVSQILSVCRSADFCFSSVLTSEEFIIQVAALSNSLVNAAGPGVSEANAVLLQMQEDKKRKTTRRFYRAFRNRRIQRFHGVYLSHGYDCEVWCLSPSDQEFNLFLEQLARYIPETMKPLRRLPALRPNNASVVFWIRIGPIAILLGGDLEESTRQGCGWTDIANDPNRPTGRAHIFKIPHHGSENAHCKLVWEKLLIENPDSCLTPYARGRVPRPTSYDVKRILNFSDRAASTSRLGSRKASRRDPVVERQIRDMEAKLRSTNVIPGRITYRNNNSKEFTSWTISLYDGAIALNNVHS